MLISLKHQVAVITGGSRGIGAAAVVFSYRKAKRQAQSVVSRCSKYGAPVIPIRAEIARMAESKKLIDTAIRRFGRLDVLVANAGIWNATPAPIETMTEKEWDEMIAVNLKGVYAEIGRAHV